MIWVSSTLFQRDSKITTILSLTTALTSLEGKSENALGFFFSIYKMRQGFCSKINRHIEKILHVNFFYLQNLIPLIIILNLSLRVSLENCWCIQWLFSGIEKEAFSTTKERKFINLRNPTTLPKKGLGEGRKNILDENSFPSCLFSKCLCITLFIFSTFYSFFILLFFSCVSFIPITLPFLTISSGNLWEDKKVSKNQNIWR